MICRATGCGKAIPSGQCFCQRCLNVLSADVRHRVRFSSRSEREKTIREAIAELDALRGPVAPTRPSTNPPSPARSRFRNARRLAASALSILDKKES